MAPDNITRSAEANGDTRHYLIDAILRWAAPAAALLYVVFTLILGLKSTGLQYDEALLQHGAVHMLNSRNRPPFMHSPESWVFFAGRNWPLVVVSYAGAVKDYLLLLPFALFGPGAEVARAVNALLGAFGIWGIATLLRSEINAGVAAAVAFTLAIHPAYLDQTLYDNGTVVVWMAVLGLAAVTVGRYKRRRSARAAFLVGLALGIGVWNRANFVWFLSSVVIAGAIVFWKRMLIPYSHLAALIGGGVVGVFPLLLFQILSGWSIFRFMSSGQVQRSLLELFGERLHMLSSVLISDNEQRSIWKGPALPTWQSYFFSLLLLVALVLCFALKQRDQEKATAWRRASAVAFVIFGLLMFSSRLNIAEHHIVTILPVAIVVVVLGFQGLIHRWRNAGIVALAIVVVYGATAIRWNVAAARGLRETGGVNMWSDAIYSVNDYLLSNHKGVEIEILDWGLQNNLYVLSNAEIKSREIFWGSTPERTGAGILWSDLIAGGGIYLTNSSENLHFPESTQGFLAALQASGRPFNRVVFRQKRGQGYAELYELDR